MTYLGLTAEQLTAHVARVVPPQSGRQGAVSAPGASSGDASTTRTRFARAVLTSLAEPGDSDAGVLIAAIGPVEALRAIVERRSAPDILAEVSEHDPAATEMLVGRLENALERWHPRASLTAAARSFESGARVRAALVTPEDDLWPASLADLGSGAPIALWVRGELGRLGELRRSVALVGARAATGYGEHVAMEVASGLADRGLSTVSGGAYGIDGAVHRASLASDATTVAFLAGGVDRLYPAGHTDLLQRVAERGLLIAELPCGSSPTKWRFLMRNRLIAAASTATVVVEAGRRSGSLNTAGHAATIGRPLGAVPGPVTSPASAGCHRLIREYGAECVTNADEIAELSGLWSPTEGSGAAHKESSGGGRSLAPEALRIIDALSARASRSVAELSVITGMSPRDVIATLGTLDVEGLARERAGRWLKAPPGTR
ncbi:DNA-processing protein DprA [Diaminobutyricibacter sp. McL0618]|uniref:DNA-processing protein DprA n=1 Tax=Leifsonia sp. McL0618 TaxID=3415677 RepID=UPI003CEEB213